MAATPNISNLSIFKAKVHFTPTGGVERDIGECPRVTTTPTLEKLDYNSNRSGVRTVVKSAIVSKKLEVVLEFSEMNADNLAMLLLGTPALNGEGNYEFDIFAESAITGSLRVEGTNDIGNKLNAVFTSVSFSPSGSLDFISEEWAAAELTGEVLEVAGSYGTLEVVDEEEVS